MRNLKRVRVLFILQRNPLLEAQPGCNDIFLSQDKDFCSKFTTHRCSGSNCTLTSILSKHLLLQVQLKLYPSSADSFHVFKTLNNEQVRHLAKVSNHYYYSLYFLKQCTDAGKSILIYLFHSKVWRGRSYR